MKEETVNRRGHLMALLLVAVVGITASMPAVGEPTFGSADALPEPDLHLTDRLRDVDVYGISRLRQTQWEDILEVSVYLTDLSLIFVVRTSGELPQASNLLRSGLLLIFLDMDGEPGHVPFSPYLFDITAVRRAGYEFAIGQRGPVGLRRVSTMSTATTTAWVEIEHWRDEDVDYFEVAWEDLGGRPNREIAFFVFTARVSRGGLEVVMDRAPNNRPGHIPAP
jgi:hypothetical protein